MAKEAKGLLPTSVRLTPTASKLWDDLSEHTGLSKAGLLEMMLREKARQEGLRVDSSSAEPVAA